MKIPGLVDLQVNGYQGVDFSSPSLTEADFVQACRAILEAGTTAFLPTVITSPQDVLEHALRLIATVMRRKEFRGRLLGIHLEGPFISPQAGARGAHNAEWIKESDIDLLERLIEWSGENVKLLTIAADLNGAEQLAQFATTQGITVSLGHQMATEEDLDRLVCAGAVSLTHFCNGVPALLPRHENPIWAGLGNDNLAAMIITDSHHLPPSVLKTIIRTKGPDRCIVISDAAPFAGLGPGTYERHGQKLVLEDSGRLYDPATRYLAGSSATMLQCVNYLASLKLATRDELISMAFYNPLKLIGLSPKDVARGRDITFEDHLQAFYLQ